MMPLGWPLHCTGVSVCVAAVGTQVGNWSSWKTRGGAGGQNFPFGAIFILIAKADALEERAAGGVVLPSGSHSCGSF